MTDTATLKSRIQKANLVMFILLIGMGIGTAALILIENPSPTEVPASELLIEGTDIPAYPLAEPGDTVTLPARPSPFLKTTLTAFWGVVLLWIIVGASTTALALKKGIISF